MIKAGIFEVQGTELETAINNWLADNKIVNVQGITQTNLHDSYADGTVCNQWISTIVVGEVEEPATVVMYADGKVHMECPAVEAEQDELQCCYDRYGDTKPMKEWGKL